MYRQTGKPQVVKLEAAIQLKRLRLWLDNQVKSLTLERLQTVQSPDNRDLLQSLVVNSTKEATLLEVLAKVEELANGSLVQPDPLGADKLPPVTETGELDNL